MLPKQLNIVLNNSNGGDSIIFESMFNMYLVLIATINHKADENNDNSNNNNNNNSNL